MCSNDPVSTFSSAIRFPSQMYYVERVALPLNLPDDLSVFLVKSIVLLAAPVKKHIGIGLAGYLQLTER